MRRRHADDEPEDLNRWMVSYADFITLLLAFFVVMYAISSVNEGKYRVLSDSLLEAFKGQPKTLQPINIGEVAKGTNSTPPDEDIIPIEQPKRNPLPERKELDKELFLLKQQFQRNLGELINADLVDVRVEGDWLLVDMRSGLLFDSGSAQPNPSAFVIVEDISTLLNKNHKLIRIRGYTDNIPISNNRFSSNWELSAARAVQIVHMLERKGVQSARLAAESFGEYSPVADNATPTGRAENRRVVVAVSPLDYSEPALPKRVDTGPVNKEPEPTDSETDPLNKIKIIRLPGGGLKFTSE